MPRNNLRETVCPICGHQFGTEAYKNVVSFEKAFGEKMPLDFYGGNVNRFTKTHCCRDYIVYWKTNGEKFVVKDIEPVDYPKFISDLDEKLNGKPVKKPQKEVEEVKAEEPKAEETHEDVELDWEELSNMKYFELKHYVADKFDVKFDKTAKKAEILKWLKNR